MHNAYTAARLYQVSETALNTLDPARYHGRSVMDIPLVGDGPESPIHEEKSSAIASLTILTHQRSAPGVVAANSYARPGSEADRLG